MQLLWFELGALALLISLLIWRFWQRAKRFAQQERALPSGHGFDTTQVQARLKQVRQDYGITAQRARRTLNHDLIVMAVRRSLKTLSYFRSKQAAPTDNAEGSSEESGV